MLYGKETLGETWISSGLMGQLAGIQTLPFLSVGPLSVEVDLYVESFANIAEANMVRILILLLNTSRQLSLRA